MMTTKKRRKSINRIKPFILTGCLLFNTGFVGYGINQVNKNHEKIKPKYDLFHYSLERDFYSKDYLEQKYFQDFLNDSWKQENNKKNSGLFLDSCFDSRKNLIERIIQKESNGNPRAFRNATKARGLMQITPVVLKEWNIYNPDDKHNENDLFDSEINKKIGEWYLFERIKNHYLPFYELNASLDNVLAAYNWGIGNLRRLGDAQENFEKLPFETRNYIKSINSM